MGLLDGRVVVITGAGGGIGREHALAMAKEGAALVINDLGGARDGEGKGTSMADGVVDEIKALGAEAVANYDNVATVEGGEGILKTALDAFERVDAVVNNAATFYPTPLHSVNEAQWNEVMDTNLKAPFFIARSAAPALRQARGCIVNVVDIHAERPRQDHAVYCMAKAALAMMTRSLARELGPEVRVNAVAPGAILWPSATLSEQAKTEIIARTALRRSGSPEDIAETVLFLIAGARYLTGQIIAVDGGRTTQQ